MTKKNLGGRPSIDPYYRADKSVKISQSQIDEMAKLGFNKYQIGEHLRRMLDTYIAAHGGNIYDRK